MIPYLLHSSILLIGFYLFYHLLLRKETFFKLNRLFFILGLLAAVVLPLITIPASMSLRQNFAKLEELRLIEEDQPIVNNIEDNALPETLEMTESENALAAANPKQELKATTESSDTTATSYLARWDLSKIWWTIYGVACLVFLVTFLIQFITVLVKKKNLAFIQDGPYRIYETTNDNAPFSFFNWIFINPSLYDFDTYNQILAHEKIHVSQAHFIDKILIELVLIFFWFNPFVWLFRKAIDNNLEYLTDKEILTKGIEKESYQFSLLKVSVPEYALSITTNYNQSFLQKRIKMMNTKKSSAQSSWKYLLLLPFLGFSIISMNAVDYNNDENNAVSLATVKLDTERPATAEERLNKLDLETPEMELAQQNPTATLDTIPKNKRKNKEKNKIKNKKKNKEKNKSKNKHYHHEWGNIKIDPGHWVGNMEGDKICMYFNNSDGSKGNSWHIHECFERSDFSNIPVGKNAKFQIQREAGTLILQGGFAELNDLGQGSFEFKANAEFTSFLKQEGLEVEKDKYLLSLFFGDMTKSFVRLLKKENYSFTIKELVSLGHHDIDKDDIAAANRIFKKLGHTDRSTKDLIKMTIHDVDEAYVNDIYKIAPSEITLKSVVSARIHNVTPEFAESMKNYGFEDLSLKDLIKLSIHNVSVDDLKELNRIGFEKITYKEAIKFAIHGVNPESIAKFKEMGYDNLTPKELVNFSIHGVSASHVNALKDLGYMQLSAKDLVSTKIHNVSASMVRGVHEQGYKDISIRELVKFSIHGVQPNFIKEMKEAGYSDLSTGDLISARIHGVSPSYRKELANLGLTDLSFKNLKSGRIHGVTRNFIEKARKKGYNPTTLKEYIKLKIHGI